MSANKAIILVGMPGAGKSIGVDYLKSKGLPSAYFGGLIIEEVKQRGLEVNEENEKLVREDVREKEGKDAFANRILRQVQQYFTEGKSAVVVDGLYTWSEYKIFKAALGEDAIIIAVVAPRSLRHQRLAKRPVRPLSEADATTRDYAEIENIEKGGPIANADYFLINTGTQDELIKALENLLSSLSIDV